MSRPINVLHTVRSLRLDGVVRLVLRNLLHLEATEFRHHVCALVNEDDLANEYRAHGFEPIFLDHRGPATVPRTIVRLSRVLRERSIDIVHANRTIDLALAGSAAKARGVAVVGTLHWLGRIADHPEDAGDPLALRWAEQMGTVAVTRVFADRLIAVSGAVKESFARLPGFPEDRVEVIHPGMLMNVAEPDAAARRRLRGTLGLPDDAPVLLNVGRLHPVKGQRHLVPMMQRVRQRRPDAVLLIAGEGELRAELAAEIARQSSGDAIRLLGARADVDALLAISDLLVLSSESEAAPLPLFEAMRAGRPVVATNVGGVAEIVREGETGYIVPRGDAAALAERVLRLLEDPARAAAMGRAARSLANREFDIAVSTRKMERIYRSLHDVAARRASVRTSAPEQQPQRRP